MPIPPVCLGVIPARARSSRFPLKMLADLHGKPLVQHVWEAAVQSSRLSRVVVATDFDQIADAVRGFGGAVEMTSEDFQSGTDRVAWVAAQTDAEIVVNLQGDEPLLPPSAIDRLVEALEADPRADMATLVVRKTDRADLENLNVVKAVVSRAGNALYFSRQPLVSDADGLYFKHIGIYAYRKDALLQFCAWPCSNLEKAERLEQLRALENGLRIRAVEIDSDTIAVDVPSDIDRVHAHLSSQLEGSR